MLLELLSPLLVLLDMGCINKSDHDHALTSGTAYTWDKTRDELLNSQKDEQKKLDFEVAHHRKSLSGRSWQITKLKDFEDEEKKRVVSIASDEDLLVVGLFGWGSQARVYDVKTGELKFTLNCGKLDENPELAHDRIMVWLNSRNIVTLGSNDNTLTIWDRNGNMVAKNLHKDKEAHKELERIKNLVGPERGAYFEERTAGMSQHAAMQLMMKIQFGIVETDKKILSLSLHDNGNIYAGTKNGILVLAEDNNGKWKIEYEVQLSFPIVEIATKGSKILVGYRDASQTVLRFWDEKAKWFAEDQKVLKVKRFSGMKFLYHFVFLYGGRGETTDGTGVEIWNLDTGERVRHLLQGEKDYMQLASNGKFMAICEKIDTWISGEEIDLKLAVYNVEQLVDPRISNEDLWNFSTSYSVKNMGFERILSSLNDRRLIVNHGATKFSVFEIEE